MPTRTRKTKLKKNSRGWIPKEVGYLDRAKQRQPKFNLGSDEKEAEKRLTRIQELFDDSQRATGLPIWTGFALHAAKLIARGIYQIPYPLDIEEQRGIHGHDALEDIAANYVQMLRVEQARYPSIQIVPDDNDAYSYGVSLNSAFEQSLLSKKEAELKTDGVITAGRKFPEKFVSGNRGAAVRRMVRAGSQR